MLAHLQVLQGALQLVHVAGPLGEAHAAGADGEEQRAHLRGERRRVAVELQAVAGLEHGQEERARDADGERGGLDARLDALQEEERVYHLLVGGILGLDREGLVADVDRVEAHGAEQHAQRALPEAQAVDR